MLRRFLQGTSFVLLSLLSLGRTALAQSEIVGAQIVSGTFPHKGDSTHTNLESEARYTYWPSPDYRITLGDTNIPGTPDCWQFRYINGAGDMNRAIWGPRVNGVRQLYMFGGDALGVGNYGWQTTQDSPAKFDYPPQTVFGRLVNPQPGVYGGLSQGVQLWKYGNWDSYTPWNMPQRMAPCGQVSVFGNHFWSYYITERGAFSEPAHYAGIFKYDAASSTVNLHTTGANYVAVGYGQNPNLPMTWAKWSNYKFITPSFINFGENYEFYDEANPGYVYPNPVYVYALSPHYNWWDEDALYLGRAQLSYSGTSSNFVNWGTWEYYCGIDPTGNPAYSTDINKARAVLYARGEISTPSIIYEPYTQKYLMTTWTNNNDRQYARAHDKQYFIWTAPRPWGPWRKIFSNDYNGLQYRAAQEQRGLGAGGYCTDILNATEVVNNKYRLWIDNSGFWNPDYNLDQVHHFPWDEAFPQTYYTSNFSQIELDTASDASTFYTYAPAGVMTKLNNERLEGTTWIGYNPMLWLGGRILTGPESCTINQLGRYYVSGNKYIHQLRLYRKSDMAEIARADVDMGSSNPVDQNGYKYANIQGGNKTLAANTEYYLIAEENLKSNHLSMRADLSTSATYCIPRTGALPQGWQGLVGYEFKTGPLGTRVTHVGRHVNVSAGQARRFVIDELTDAGAFSSRLLDVTINPTITEDQYKFQQLTTPVELKPLTHYAIGTYVYTSDLFYGGPGAYLFPEMMFDPDVCQFVKAIYTNENPDTTWITSTHPGKGFVFGPITFKAQVADRSIGLMSDLAPPGDTMPRIVKNSNFDLTIDHAVWLSPGDPSDPKNHGYFGIGTMHPMDGRNACYGPVDFRASTGTALTQSYETNGWKTSGCRSDWYGWLGMEIRVGFSDITISQLGRYCDLSSLNQSHQLAVFDSNSFIVTSTTLPSGPCIPNAIKYATLPAAYTLKAGHVYYIASYEPPTAPRDNYYGWPSNFATVHGGAAIQFMNPVQSGAYSNGEPIGVGEFTAAANTIFGPLNIRFTPNLAHLIPNPTSIAATAPTTNGFCGFVFKTKNLPVAVRELGRYCFTTNALSHEVRIVKVNGDFQNPGNDSSQIICSVLINASGTTSNGWRLQRLATPALLEPNTSYYIGSYEAVSGDTYAKYNTTADLPTNSNYFYNVLNADGAQTSGIAGAWATGSTYPRNVLTFRIQ